MQMRFGTTKHKRKDEKEEKKGVLSEMKLTEITRPANSGHSLFFS